MGEHEIIAETECSGMTDSWTEYLCLEHHPDGSVTLSSMVYDILSYEGDFEGEVVWPEGAVPENYDPETNRYEYDPDLEDQPLPISIAGKPVGGFEDGSYIGTELVLPHDEATATFKPGEGLKAREWAVEHYSGCLAALEDDALQKIEAALSPPR